MRETEQQGKDVQAAIDAGLAQLRLRRDQVEVVIKEKGSSGFFGIGSKPAVVLIREKRWDNRGGGGEQPRRSARQQGGRGGRGGRPERGGGQGRFDRRPPRQRREKEFTNYERPEKVQCPSEGYEEVHQPEAPLPKQELQPVPETSSVAAAESKQALEQVLTLIGVKHENMEIGWDPTQERLVLRFDCDSPALVIGKEGQTIEALQYVVTLMVARKHD
ncbi:MAG TPA: Jag N-terminal domain-containing protein, partial [Elusimicrobiales bacterium]|nr:Jag N-terminal domain-containing protein [Elusimicrobiales bacterium]